MSIFADSISAPRGVAAPVADDDHASAAAAPSVPAQRGPWPELAHDHVMAAPLIGTGATLRSGMRPDTTLAAWLRSWGLHVELGLTACLGAAVAATASTPWIALASLGVWLVAAFYRGRAATTPLQGQLRGVISAAMLPAALLSVGAASFGISSADLSHALGTVAVTAAATAVFRGLRWTLQAPIRVIVVGDRASVASSVSQLPRTSRARVVAAVVAEEGLSAEDTPSVVLGVTAYSDLTDIRRIVTDHEADLVLVDPGRSVSASDFRDVTWALEGMRVAMGVTGVLGPVAPHRIAAGRLGRQSVLDVRTPQPSRFVRTVKGVVDRVLGVVALALAAPILLVLMAAVRLDSPGTSIFTQIRVGKGGRPFRVYKLRTMVADADDLKDLLREVNEADSVLFKVRQDPRITRLGRFLRRSSLDELPQLINVVRGEMSLVGPRPHLPEEVERMDSVTRRRHAVLPGITGAWQVGGRSDLTWREAAELDTHYADNWTLSGDASILARTVRAVVSRKGAY